MPNSNYIEYIFTIDPVQPGSEILMAELAELEFESFIERENGLSAYIKKKDWNENLLEGISITKNPDFEISIQTKEIEQQNWNETWERNFEPIQVENRCRVRAPFHEKSDDVEYDIVIEPKMSFGTGHHETTQMMLQHVLDHDCQGKSILDMGCGTGVLAILAEMKGASNIDAIDIDHWCYLNSIENIARNSCEHINVFEGDVRLLKNQKYNTILANINRNILLQDIPKYVLSLHKNGALFLSGFYESDIALISKKCAEYGLKPLKKLKKNKWLAMKYTFS